MSRRAITKWDVAAQKLAVHSGTIAASEQAESQDDFSTALLKYIPGEIVAAFVLVNGVMGNAKAATWAYWAVFAALSAATPLYLWRVTQEPGTSLPIRQLVSSTIAFGVWVFALGGPFSQYTWYASWYGAVLLPIYSVFIPIVMGHASKS